MFGLWPDKHRTSIQKLSTNWLSFGENRIVLFAFSVFRVEISNSDQNFFGSVVKVAFKMSRETGSENFNWNIRNAFNIPRKRFWKKIVWKKCLTSCFFRALWEQFRTLTEVFQPGLLKFFLHLSGLSQLHPTCPEENFERKLKSKK